MKLRNKERLRRAKGTHTSLGCIGFTKRLRDARDKRMLLLKLRAEGMYPKQAAEAAGLSESGAEYHWSRICEHIGTSNFALIVQWALYNGYAEWKVKPEQVAA